MNFTVEHPPLKIIAALFVTMMGVSVARPETVLFLVMLGQGWLFIGRVPVLFFWKRLRLMAPFVLFSFLFFPLYEHGRTIDLFGMVPVSLNGVEKALVYCGRLLFAVQTLTLLFYRMPAQLFFQSLARIKVPVIFVELALFTLRYMELFRAEASSMLKSVRSRGGRWGTWFSVRAYATLSKLVGSLFLRSFRRSERIYMGMLSRGYQGVVAGQPAGPPRRADIVNLLLWVVPAACLFVWDKM